MPRFQFTLLGMLWATFWAAVCVAAWTLVHRNADSSSSWWWQLGGLAVWAAPFAAVGALFGRALWGLAIGMFLAVVLTANFLAF